MSLYLGANIAVGLFAARCELLEKGLRRKHGLVPFCPEAETAVRLFNSAGLFAVSCSTCGKLLWAWLQIAIKLFRLSLR